MITWNSFHCISLNILLFIATALILHPIEINLFSFYFPHQQQINLLFLRCNASNSLALNASSAVSNRSSNNHVCVQDNTN